MVGLPREDMRCEESREEREGGRVGCVGHLYSQLGRGVGAHLLFTAR